MASNDTQAADTEAAATSATQSFRQLSLEHDPSTPDVISEDDAAAAPVASTSATTISPPDANINAVEVDGQNTSTRKPFERTDDGKITGAPTRLGGRILHEGRDPWTHNAW